MSSQTIISDFDPNGMFADLVVPPRLRWIQSKTRFKQEWRIPYCLYLALMNEFRGPKRQRGSIIIAASTSAAGQIRVILTNHSITNQEVDPTDARAGVEFRNDGSLQERRGVVAVYTDIAGEYLNVQPQSGIGNDWAVRALAAGASGGWSSAAAADDTWIDISGTRGWRRNQTVIGTATTSRTFEVGPASIGPADDSATITCIADVIA